MQAGSGEQRRGDARTNGAEGQGATRPGPPRGRHLAPSSWAVRLAAPPGLGERYAGATMTDLCHKKLLLRRTTLPYPVRGPLATASCSAG